jgi:hypothetical protein
MALTAGIRREQTHPQSSITAEDRSMITTTIKAMSGFVQRRLKLPCSGPAYPKDHRKTTPARGRRGSLGFLGAWSMCRGGTARLDNPPSLYRSEPLILGTAHAHR